MEKIKVIELFGGIGACSKALDRLKIPYEVADYVEIDKYACASFNALHGSNFEPQDIRKWDKDIQADLIMHGSPCQDFSLAGKLAGGDKGSGTRSSLMYETLRIVEKVRPKYVIWENVRNVLSARHRHNFEAYNTRMECLGYMNFAKVLNAKDYGIPQNRDRVFAVSILKDVPYCWAFEFPEKTPLTRKLKDFLDPRIALSYYLPFDQASKLLYEPSEHPPFKVKTANSKGYDIAIEGDGVDLAYPNSKTRRGRVGHGVAKTLSTNDSMGAVQHGWIRHLTPLEYWRLMGFDDDDYAKAASVNSRTQLYKQAGNSIVVNVLEAILKRLFNNERR